MAERVQVKLDLDQLEAALHEFCREQVEPKIKVVNDLKSIFNEKKFSDVTIVLNKSELYAHKAILSARSPVFSAMFQHEMLENRTNQVTITDIKDEVFLDLLKFIYTGSVELNIDVELLLAAEKYGLEDLRSLCGKTLSRNLTLSNAIDTLVMADRLKVQDLKSAAIKFINQHAAELIQTESYQLLVKSHLHLIEELYRHKLSLK